MMMLSLYCLVNLWLWSVKDQIVTDAKLLVFLILL